MGGGGGGRGGRGGGGGGTVNWEAAYDDHTGFISLFDGETLNGWDGETNVWMINDGSIHSDNVNNSSGQHHIHYVGVGHNLRDFDLKVEFKIVGGNGGIHYRSRMLNMARSYDGQPRQMYAPETKSDPIGKPLPAGVTTLEQAQAAIPGLTGNPWQISGYQFDITGNNTGSLYEGQGRGVVANSGEVVQFAPGGGRTIISQTSDIPYAQFGNPDGWNKAEIIARGNLLVHMLNGRVFMVAIDDDPERAALEGIISLQLEGTGQIWYRNIWLKNL